MIDESSAEPFARQRALPRLTAWAILASACGSRTPLEVGFDPSEGTNEGGGAPNIDCPTQPSSTSLASLAPDSATVYCVYGSSPTNCMKADQLAFGEDGSYRIRVPVYTTTYDTVVDSVTTLMWQRVAPVRPFDQAEADAYCPSLTLAGQSDWRLPSRIELASIIDYGRSGPAIDPTTFVNIPETGQLEGGCFWTGTPSNRDSSTRWRVCFGSDSEVLDYAPGVGMASYVRCVRGNVLPPGYRSVCKASAVLDSRTGLMWQKQVNEVQRGYPESLAYCEALSLGGFTDWRLPSVKELTTIVADSSLDPPHVDPAEFPGTPIRPFWSSTPVVGPANDAWAVEFQGYGEPGAHGLSGALDARCVR